MIDVASRAVPPDARVVVLSRGGSPDGYHHQALILQSLGLGEALVARGNPSARLALHFEAGRVAQVTLGGFAAGDTRFPFILFVSQAETEALLDDHLGRQGAIVERGVELLTSSVEHEFVRCVLRHADALA